MYVINQRIKIASILRLVSCVCVSLFVTACLLGEDQPDDNVVRPSRIAADSTNARLAVVSEGTRIEEAALTFIDTTENRVIFGRPVLNRRHNEEFLYTLSYAPTSAAMLPSPALATTSRLFVAGALEDETTGERALNRVSVFDFDGTTLSVPTFSPIVVQDDDDLSDDTTSIIADIVADPLTDRVFVLNKTAAQLMVYDAADGTTIGGAPLDLPGTPVSLSLLSELGYLAISSITDLGGTVTIIDVDDLSVVSQIASDTPFRDIDLAVTGDELVLAGIVDDDVKLELYSLDLDLDTMTLLGTVTETAETTDTSNGTKQETLITGTLTQVDFTRSSTGELYAYCAQSDGNILVAHLDSTLADFFTFAIESKNELQESIAVVENTATGDGAFVYVSSTHDELIDVTPVGDESDFARIR